MHDFGLTAVIRARSTVSSRDEDSKSLLAAVLARYLSQAKVLRRVHASQKRVLPTVAQAIARRVWKAWREENA